MERRLVPLEKLHKKSGLGFLKKDYLVNPPHPKPTRPTPTKGKLFRGVFLEMNDIIGSFYE